MQSRNLDKNADEVRKFTNGKVELANLGDATIGRYTAEPGWKWSKDVKPIVNTNSCQVTHTQYVISGRMRVRMDDGTEQEFGSGEAVYVPPGHDAWVVGNEPFVAVVNQIHKMDRVGVEPTTSVRCNDNSISYLKWQPL
jgi:mannose-6-phosphate isomerase-like protein (cupin superfamily)